MKSLWAGKFATLPYWIGLVAIIVLVPIVGTLNAQAQPPSPYVRLARTIELARYGLAQPVGLAYLPSANVFLSQPAGGGQNLQSLTLLEDPAAAVQIAASVDVPISLTFDRANRRLLFYERSNAAIVEVKANASGTIDPAPAAVDHHNLRALAISQADGLAVDPANGTLYILDSAKQRIVRIAPSASKRFDADQATRDGRVALINLRPAGITAPRGLALDPTSGRLYVYSSATRALYELNERGQVTATRDLSFVNLRSPQAMLFAPSGDGTDSPAQQSLYIADSGTSTTNSKIAELSLAAPALPDLAAAAEPAVVLRTILTSQWSPASPDPMGIAYISSTGRLLTSDSEVEEMTIYANKNMFDSSLAGSVGRTGVTLPWSDEPTGVAFNPANQHIFISDDDADEVFEIAPGGDGQYFTSDDTRTSFDTRVINNMDSEGIAYDSRRGHLYLADGLNSEVYKITPGNNGRFDGIAPAGDDIATHYDSTVLGIADPEGIEYNASTDTLFLTGHGADFVVELTLGGTLLRSIDVAFMRAPSGLAIGSASANAAATSLYVTDRGVDNDTDPKENDGKIYELALTTASGPTNTPTSTPTSTPIGPTNTPTSTPTSTPIGPTSTPTSTPVPPASPPFYLSFSGSATLNGVSIADEDIVSFANGTFSTLFDGSDVGVTGDIDAFTIVDADTILFSVDAAATLPTVGLVDDFDIIQFDATSLGSTTAGTFSLYFDGSDVGMDSTSEDIDAFEILADGRLLISTNGSPTLAGVTSWRDEDILAFTPTALGATTSGSWALYFDGSDVDLATSSSEDVDALAIGANGDLYLSTSGLFSVPGVTGDNEDVFICRPTALGDTTACSYQPGLFFDGSAFALAANNVDAIDLP